MGMKILKLVGGKYARSESISYHGRIEVRPIIYVSYKGRRYTMVHRRDGSLKKLYEGSKYSE